MKTLIRQALTKGGEGERLTRDEALALLELLSPRRLYELQCAALKNRDTRFGRRATFVSNLQINPSNICEGTCRFCRYAAKPGDADAYVMTDQEILERIAQARPTEVHIVGGMNREWPFERGEALVRSVRRQWPKMHIKAFTAVEIDYFARETGLDIAEVLRRLLDAGVDALPGGGAELFSARMRRTHCPSKLSPEGWVAIHRQAHGLGMTTNATMLYGLDETGEERVEHLLTLRAAQDASRGFSCFIPLPYQPGKSADALDGPSPFLDLGMVALARLVLDNIDHIKAYWPMTGLETAAAALSFGADDLDGTIGEERIAHAAGAPTPRAVTRERMTESIAAGGFEPAERDGKFNIIDGGAHD